MEVAEKKILKINRNKSASGSTSSRIVLPAKWVKELNLFDEIEATFDGEKIIITKIK